ncbi:hypothetical protein LAZ67_11001874 [Cordylochernes scorpioides]|uniref:ATP-dependent DNA helicase n=1 Tax=Cordylochernes scorpioides TaxID=51811 RepID=A0ABY6L1I0_9ARAC|nr:hypothetical protein LAZ67_11001874 [Cordylochernes scorpioides]
MRQEFAAWVFRKIDIDEKWLSNVLWTDDAHFSLNGESNIQNSRFWATENPRNFTEMPLYQPRVTVLEKALSEITFMKVGGPPHISRGAKQLLKNTFVENRVISRHFIYRGLQDHQTLRLAIFVYGGPLDLSAPPIGRWILGLSIRQADDYILSTGGGADFLPKPISVAGFCGALRWKDESYGMCCSNGKVRLPLIDLPPEPLRSLLSGENSDSVHFLRNIRKYNSCFQMTSFGAENQTHSVTFPTTFSIQGQVYHRIGSHIPSEDQPNRTPPGQHPRRYNAPTANEVAVVLAGNQFGSRDIVLRERDNVLQHVSDTHSFYDALQYPLIFWKGQEGYSFNIPQIDPNTRQSLSSKVSSMDIYDYLMAGRNSSNVIVQFGQLFHQFLVDMYAKKRELPHAHILVWLANKFRPTQIDTVICAEFPDPIQDPLLYNIVVKNMIHGPCGGPSTSTSLPPAEDEIATLWFQFEDKNTGTKAKIKCRPHVHSKPNTLSVDWVPVHKKVVNISLTKTVKCKRKQFPCVPACAITIHKAQGGTFTTIVYKYSSKQPQQLVYVAMSRVTSIDGLYIITEKDSPLVFKHGRDGNDSQTTRDIRNEYLRLRGHTLDTITKQAVKFCDDATDAGQLIVTNINCQSLSAHAADIETDTVIPRSDYLVLTETWMRDTCEPTPIKGYECVSRENNRSNSDINAAGGVAIYRKLSSTSTAEVFQVAITDVTRVIKTKGDMCMTEVTCFAANTSFKFILGAVYIHPGASMQDIGMLLWQGLGPYIHNSQYVPPFVQIDSSIPILLCGDFNKNVKPDNSFLNFMKNTYNLDCVSNVSKSTTLKGTTIDLTFARHITAETLPFISYFSYHRPILNKITQIGIS